MTKIFTALLSLLVFASNAFALLPEEQRALNAYLDTAFSAYVEKDYDKAMMNFQKVLQIDPTDLAALTGIEQCRKKLEKIRKDDYKEAQKTARDVRRLVRKQKWLDAIDIVSLILARIPDQTEALKLQEEIESLLRQRIAKDPASVDAMVHQGMLYYLQKRYDQAVKIWRDVAAVSKDQFKVSIYIERALRTSKEYERQEVLVSGRSRARTAFESGNYAEAAEIWRKILEFDPYDPEAKSGFPKAQALAEKKNRQSLIGEHYDRGLSLFTQGSYAESLAEWESILAVDPQNEVARNYVAKIAKKGVTRPAPKSGGAGSAARSAGSSAAGSSSEPSGSAAPAAASASASTAPVPAVSPVASRNELGYDLYRSGKYQESIEFFERQLRKDPNDAEASEWRDKVQKEQKETAEKHYNQGLIAYSEGQVDVAIREWQETLKVSPYHAPTLRILNKVSEGNVTQ